MELFRVTTSKSKKIAILAIFSAMAIMLEVFPILGITDLKLVPAVPSFTIDWTGIPLSFIFLGLGFTYSVVAVFAMGAAIGYRNPVGAVFKVASELLTLIGMLLGFLIHRKLTGKGMRTRQEQTKASLVLLGGSFLRMAGMYVVNIILLPLLVGLPSAVAITVSGILVPWNGLQAVINILGGFLIMKLIPEDLALQAELGDQSEERLSA
jgi:riboflavin transporter FmnP